MRDLESFWRAKEDDSIVDAGKNLNSFTDNAVSIIIAEHRRRGLPEPELDKTPVAPKIETTTKVVLVGVEITFGQMMGLIFKFSLAAVPTILFWGVLFLLTQIR